MDNSQEIIEGLKQEIASLKTENKKLINQMENSIFGKTLQNAFQFLDITSVVTAISAGDDSLKHLLEMTARVLDSEAASILLYDKNNEELYFREAIGEKAELVKKFRLKPNEGIAGYCFTTGQTLAIADVMQDARFKREIAQSINMEQKALIAAPLIYRDEVIGVMEALNKRDGGAFTGDDVEIIGAIANFSASFIQRIHIKQDLHVLFVMMIKKLLLGDNVMDFTSQDLIRIAKEIEQDLTPSGDFQETLELASLVEDICRLGPEEHNLVKSILGGFKYYLQERGIFSEDSRKYWVSD
jgi:transcriptional regulator with GAF, ATPase, and Fis domain